ncbi:hypothetical protein QUB56_30030, partial [Microcoleus sp. AR_TQ3_B6]|uniref:hypothetical protein n=1 Tax=Microcoleus sp. AR_TQ3_B6 TaxID=3055284 RepID=UPI002FD387DE
ILPKTRFLTTRPQSIETGFFPISSPVTKYSRKNPVSDHPSNHGKIKIGVTDNSRQWKKSAPKLISN